MQKHNYEVKSIIEFGKEFVIAYDAYFKEHEYGFTVTVPNLPGCIVSGKTISSAISSTNEAIFCWLQDTMVNGESIPLPTDKHGQMINDLGERIVIYCVMPKEIFNNCKKT